MEYEVKAIEAPRFNKDGEITFRVHWNGYPKTSREPISNLVPGCLNLIQKWIIKTNGIVKEDFINKLINQINEIINNN